jgi:hypothetical protein
MKDALRGNFTPRKKVDVDDSEPDLTEKFEKEALKQLGGSIAFVSRKKFLYRGKEEEGEGEEKESDGKEERPSGSDDER